MFGMKIIGRGPFENSKSKVSDGRTLPPPDLSSAAGLYDADEADAATRVVFHPLPSDASSTQPRRSAVKATIFWQFFFVNVRV